MGSRSLAAIIGWALLFGALIGLPRHEQPGGISKDPVVVKPFVDNRGPEYKLPPSELSPNQIVIGSEAGDVADWGHAAIGAPDAQKKTKGKGVLVAILDTGCDHDHPDLKDRIKASKDFTGSRSGDADVQGHGTHCAGVVAASENGSGMIGIAPECHLLIGKVLSDTGSGYSTWIAAGIDWAVEEGADVISMSLGSSVPDPRIAAAVKRALDKGVIVVAAAGNEGPGDGTVGFPGGHDGVICVAASNITNTIADFSSRGEQVVVSAPGVNVRSCYPGGRFATMSGTSMATPYVAGVAALYVADCKLRGEKASPAGFLDLLIVSSKDLAPVGKDNRSGYGLVQPDKIVRGKPEKPPAPPVPPDVDKVIIEFETPVPFPGGRKLKRVIYEFEPVVAPAPQKKGEK